MKRSQLIRRNMLKAACARTGKRRFDTVEAAQIALDTAAYWRARGDKQRQERRHYPCDFCSGWHLSSERKRIPARSKKTAKVYREQRVPLVAQMLALYPVCQIRWDENCTNLATEVDEICGRGRGGDILDPANLQTGCHNCHQAKTANPAEAERRGLGMSSADYRQNRKDTSA